MTGDFPAGNYRFIPAVFQYSSGVAANRGFEIERVRFDQPVALAEGFAQIAKYIQAAGRPLTSFCACELRSPAAFTDEGFRNFNLHYVKTLSGVGDLRRQDQSGGAQQCLPRDRSAGRAVVLRLLLHAPERGHAPSFVIAGSGESLEGGATYAERTVRYRDLSPDGLKEKIRYVVGAMERRMGEFGFGWKDATAAQTYTVHDFHPVFAEELVRRGAARSGLTWHFARPPVIDLEYEMDCRRVMRELVI